MRLSRANKELMAKRQALVDAFNSWRDQKLRDYNDQREERIELRGGRDMDDHDNEGVEEETVEFLVKEKSTIFQD